MQPRVFVVMPFGTKQIETREGPKALDYNTLYSSLFAPALRAAGCEPFRADQEAAAGDIRTDMFFELVTADAILADVTHGNANVFYELGIRHGICARGAFMVHGGWSDFRPFDLAPDRTFGYDGGIFLTGSAPNPDKLEAEVEALANRIRQALENDRRTVGSPVYNSLQGLKPVEWHSVQTARFRYFSGVLDDWKQRVRIARKNGYPGDILTLAEDAPTRYHKEELLMEAAKALMDLCRFEIAESVLREILDINPENFNARCWLGTTLGRRGRSAQAEEQIRQALALDPDEPETEAKFGRLYKDTWRSHWEQLSAIPERYAAAMQHSGFALSALKAYHSALMRNPDSYYAGINVLLLRTLLNFIGEKTGDEVDDAPEIDCEQLHSVVSFNARARLNDQADRIYALATLGMLAVLKGDAGVAKRRTREVAGSPDVTVFQLTSIKDDLALLRKLEFQPLAVDAALSALPPDRPRHDFERVFVFSGHMIDAPGRPPRFPPEKEGAVREALAGHLEKWKTGPGDLALSGAAHGGDILFAEICRDRGAHVRLMLAEPSQVYLKDSVRGRATSWEDRYFSLVKTSEVRTQTDELGRPPENVSPHARNNLWLVNTARVEATPDRIFALMVWNGETTPGLYGTGHFAARVEELGGRIQIVDPMQL